MPINRNLFCLTMLAALFDFNQANAQLLRSPFDTCHVCPKKTPRVVCVPDACRCPCPQVETTLVPRQQITYRDVPETRYRQETVTQQVPVTRYRNVTVDEGGYQTVWVPKVVTKQIPETVYEPRTVSRMVPYQTVTRVPELSTTYQPQTVIRPYAVGAIPTPAITPYPGTISVTPTTVTPSAPQAAGNPVQLDPNLTRNTNTSYDNQIAPQGAGKVSASSAAVFRRFQ